MSEKLKMKELLAKPENWTKGFNARDKDKNPSGATSLNAVCWCLYGAKIKCYGFPGRVDISEKLDNAAMKRGFENYVKFNDHPDTTHADILSLLEEADV